MASRAGSSLPLSFSPLQLLLVAGVDVVVLVGAGRGGETARGSASLTYGLRLGVELAGGDGPVPFVT